MSERVVGSWRHNLFSQNGSPFVAFLGIEVFEPFTADIFIFMSIFSDGVIHCTG